MKLAELNQTNIDDFRRWLIAGGWTIEQTFEPRKVLQAHRPDRKHPVMIWAHEDGRRYIPEPRDRTVVLSFLRSRRKT